MARRKPIKEVDAMKLFLLGQSILVDLLTGESAQKTPDGTNPPVAERKPVGSERVVRMDSRRLA